MNERWVQSNQALPDVDITDILQENPCFNNNKKVQFKHQAHPEYAQ
jgi:hypothetical protein